MVEMFMSLEQMQTYLNP